jgi:hypothetical protein
MCRTLAKIGLRTEKTISHWLRRTVQIVSGIVLAVICLHLDSGPAHAAPDIRPAPSGI